MKQLLLSIAAISATTLGAYVMSTEGKGSAGAYTTGKAVPLHFAGTIVLDTVLTHPATGERIRFRGAGYYETNGTLQKNKVTALSRFAMKGISGVSLATGKTYAGNGTTAFLSGAPLRQGTASWTDKEAFTMHPSGGKGNRFALVARMGVSVRAGETKGGVQTSFAIE